MTAQTPDVLLHEGQEFPLFSNPLELLWNDARPRPRFVATSTALWRGYVATWVIEGGRLYLTKLEGQVAVGEEGAPQSGPRDFMQESLGLNVAATRTQPASLHLLFPEAGARVFAEWFSGVLRVPAGRTVHYVHMGYESVHEREVLMTIERGVVTGSEEIDPVEQLRERQRVAKERLEEVRPTSVDDWGWAPCPHCGQAFCVRDKKHWDGQRHWCGGRIALS